MSTLAVVAALAAVLPETAGAEAGVRLVVQLDSSGVVSTSSTPGQGELLQLPADGRVLRADPRTRIAEFPAADGRWEGRPVQRERGSLALVVPASLVGSSVALEVHGWPPLALDVPEPSEELERGEPPQVFTLQDSGPVDVRQDIVFLADGYREEELQSFLDHVDEAVAHIQSVEPYSRYTNLLNVHAVFVASSDSGSDHLELVPQILVDTALGCYFGAFGIDRLLACDDDAVLAAAAAAPDDDVRIVLVNDPAYGGSGGSEYAVASASEEMAAVVVHEMAHTDAALADEYDYGYGSSGAQTELPNCHWSAEGPPWQAWVEAGSEGVGAFVGCSYSDYVRPTDEACLMNVLQDQHCVVCREQLVRRFYTPLDSLIQGVTPGDGLPLELASDEEGLLLELSLVEIEAPPLQVRWVWLEEDIVLAEGADVTSLELTGQDLDEGLATIQAWVEDPTDWVLSERPDSMLSVASFQVDVTYQPLSPVDGAQPPGGSSSGCASCGDQDSEGFSRVSALPLLFLLGAGSLSRRRRS